MHYLNLIWHNNDALLCFSLGCFALVACGVSCMLELDQIIQKICVVALVTFFGLGMLSIFLAQIP